MELIGLFVLVIDFAFGYMLGEQKGIRRGADQMYTHLYENGVRKNDHVIVKLEYEDRYQDQEF